MRRWIQALMVVAMAGGPALLQEAQAKPPVVTDADRAEAARIAQMPSADPTSRVRMLLAARELDDSGMFALAEIHPGLVEQLMDDDLRRAVNYIAQLPPPELHRVRQGDTIVRSAKSMTPSERKRVDVMVESVGLKAKKFQALRIGPLEGRVVRVEITALGKRKKIEARSIELAWPS
ncbi:MAG: hypothetical protein AAFV53_38555, partial [Myxococcota bacterium]